MGLRDASGWVALADKTGTPGFPVWSHPDYALACATAERDTCFAAGIDVYALTDDWLPGMDERGVPVTVFPTPSMNGAWMKPGELRRYLTEELEKYG